MDELSEVEQKMEHRKKGSSETARASTTDPEARNMKMPDGALFPHRQKRRPAYNVPFAATTETLVIVGPT